MRGLVCGIIASAALGGAAMAAEPACQTLTPALIGGVLIGAAAQIAKTVVGNGDASGTSGSCPEVGVVMHTIQVALSFLHLHA